MPENCKNANNKSGMNKTANASVNNAKSAKAAQNSTETRNDPIKTVVEREILPAGTPKSCRSRANDDANDPPVPNRAHTEMKNNRSENKVP